MFGSCICERKQIWSYPDIPHDNLQMYVYVTTRIKNSLEQKLHLVAVRCNRMDRNIVCGFSLGNVKVMMLYALLLSFVLYNKGMRTIIP